MTTKIFKSFLVLVLLILGIGNAWAGKAYMKAQTADPAKGLVYMNKNGTAPSGISAYKRYYPGGSGKDSGNESCYVQVGTANGPHNNYYWAIAARGYKFKTWDGYTKKFTARKFNGLSKFLYSLFCLDPDPVILSEFASLSVGL